MAYLLQVSAQLREVSDIRTAGPTAFVRGLEYILKIQHSFVSICLLFVYVYEDVDCRAGRSFTNQWKALCPNAKDFALKKGNYSGLKGILCNSRVSTLLLLSWSH
jgi:hypothetical protein